MDVVAQTRYSKRNTRRNFLCPLQRSACRMILRHVLQLQLNVLALLPTVLSWRRLPRRRTKKRGAVIFMTLRNNAIQQSSLRERQFLGIKCADTLKTGLQERKFLAR